MTVPSLFDEPPGVHRRALLAFLAKPRNQPTIKHWGKQRGMGVGAVLELLAEMLEDEAIEESGSGDAMLFVAIEPVEDDESDDADGDDDAMESDELPDELAVENDEEPTPMPPPVAPALPVEPATDHRADLLAYLEKPHGRIEVRNWGVHAGLSEPATKRLLEELLDAREVTRHGHPSQPRFLRAGLPYAPHAPNVPNPPAPKAHPMPPKTAPAPALSTSRPKTFGPALGEAIATAKMKRTEVGKHVGVSESIIGYWMRGTYAPRPDAYDKLCKLFPALRACPPVRDATSKKKEPRAKPTSKKKEPRAKPASKKKEPRAKPASKRKPAEPKTPKPPVAQAPVAEPPFCVAVVQRGGTVLELKGAATDVVAMLRGLGVAGEGR